MSNITEKMDVSTLNIKKQVNIYI